MEHKSYYAIIPANVRYDRTIPDGAKLLYGEITALCNERGHCWATNGYFAELYGTSDRTIRRWISELTRAGHISTLVDKETNTSRKIWLADAKSLPFEVGQKRPGGRTKMSGGVGQKRPEGADKNVLQNNTVNNTMNSERDTREILPNVSSTLGTTFPPSPQVPPPPPSPVNPWQPVDPAAELQIMLTDEACKARFFQQCRIPLTEYQSYLEGFRMKLNSEERKHINRQDFRSHFFSWATIQYKNRPADNGAYAPRRPLKTA